MFTQTYTIRLDTVGDITYLGKAAVGSLEASLVWQLKKMTTLPTGLQITYPDSSSSYNYSWTARDSYTYS